MTRLSTTLVAAFVLHALAYPVFAQQAGAPASREAANTSNVIQRNEIPDTLMFTVDEINEIQSRMAAGNQAGSNERSADGIENATLYLSTILYFGPENWTVWINGAPIGPRHDFQEFEITAIDSNSVELVVPLSAQGMRPVRLAPNQTFVARTGDIVEGPWK
ncbi:MAG: hypothetical protein AB7E79_03715 [Rhodospirillaceae bacterium]